MSTSECPLGDGQCPKRISVKDLSHLFGRYCHKLRKSNFKIQMDKCEFLQKEIAFLRHIITPEGIKPNPAKMHAIKNFPIPKTRTEIKAFLGLIRKFIKDMAK